MDISTSNIDPMFHESAEGGGSSATAAIEMPSLQEIAKESPENAEKRMEAFISFYEKMMRESADSIFNNHGMLTEVASELQIAQHEVIDAGKVDLLIQLLGAQNRLSNIWSEMIQNAPDQMSHLGPIDPFLMDTVMAHAIGTEVLDSKMSEGEKEQILQAMEKEATEKKVELGEVNLTKKQINQIAQKMAEYQNDPEMMARINAADENEVIQAAPEEVEAAAQQMEKESGLWKFTKKALLYLAIGGVLAGLTVWLAPGVAAAIKGWIDGLFPGVLDSLAEGLRNGITVVRDGLVWIGDKISNVWNSLWGINESLGGIENTTERLADTLRDAAGGVQSSPVPNLPGLPGMP